MVSELAEVRSCLTASAISCTDIFDISVGAALLTISGIISCWLKLLMERGKRLISLEEKLNKSLDQLW